MMAVCRLVGALVLLASLANARSMPGCFDYQANFDMTYTAGYDKQHENQNLVIQEGHVHIDYDTSEYFVTGHFFEFDTRFIGSVYANLTWMSVIVNGACHGFSHNNTFLFDHRCVANKTVADDVKVGPTSALLYREQRKEGTTGDVQVAHGTVIWSQSPVQPISRQDYIVDAHNSIIGTKSYTVANYQPLVDPAKLRPPSICHSVSEADLTSDDEETRQIAFTLSSMQKSFRL